MNEPTHKKTLTAVCCVIFGLFVYRSALYDYLKSYFVQRLNKQVLIKVLDDVAKQSICILTDMSQLICSLRQNFERRGLMNVLSLNDLQAMLMEESFEQRLQEAQDQVLKKHNVTEADVSFSCNLYVDCPEIQDRVNGIIGMLNSSSEGILPYLPCTEIPSTLKDPSAVLNILEKIKNGKLDAIQNVLLNCDTRFLQPSMDPTSTKISPLSPQFNMQLTEATLKTEQDVIKQHSHLVESMEMWRHVLATYSRDPDFNKKQQALQESLATQIIASVQSAMEFVKHKTDQTSTVSEVFLVESTQVNSFAELENLVFNTERRATVCYVISSEDGEKLLDQYNSSIQEWTQSNQILMASVQFIHTSSALFDSLLEAYQYTLKKPEATSSPKFHIFLNSCITKSCSNVEDVFDHLQQLATESYNI